MSRAATRVAPPREPAAPGHAVIGERVLRKEDRPLLTGTSCFIDDLELPGAAHAAILRSPHGHAKVRGVDPSRAITHPGVIGVLTADDVPAEARIPMRMYRRPGMERFLQPPLARDRVRYSGEPVGVVIAESRYLAEDAVELIEVDYEPLGVALDGPEALADDAPVLFEEAETNLAATLEIADGDIDAAFASADEVVAARLACHRHAAVPLETRGLAAAVEGSGETLTVWGAAKIVHTNRRILAAMLRWPEARVRLVELHVGGGFGARGEFYPEDYLIPLAAIRFERAVRWTEDREEHLRTINHSREQVHRVELALSGEGEFLGLRDRFTFNTGAYVRTHGLVVPSMTAALLPGPYRWPAYRCQLRHVVSNKTPAGTYRAPGRYEANFVRERIIDIAAHRLGLDPAEIRRRNLVPPAAMPFERGTHTEGKPVIFDSGDYAGLLDKASDRFDLPGLLSWRRAAPDPGRRRGVGLGFFVEKSGIANWEYARVETAGEGRVIVQVGSASLGQGVETVLAQICAEALGIPYEDVAELRHGDTDAVPDGVGSFGSRATMIAGSAVHEAALALAERLESEGATLLDAEAGLSEESTFNSERMSFPYGLHCAAVEVDEETGGVEVMRYCIAYDVGRAINPALVEGQIVGGAAQGVGGALLEELAYDAEGQLVAGTFLDYMLPTAGEAPPVEVLVTEDAPTPLTPLGAKGAGEGGTAAAGAAIANAVSDALGAEATELPLSPERVMGLARSAMSASS
ncbi:MAG: xanthine dehydrogenase family protein molybdopterin-binding subunit [Solirubrobacterales bacterium]